MTKARKKKWRKSKSQGQPGFQSDELFQIMEGQLFSCVANSIISSVKSDDYDARNLFDELLDSADVFWLLSCVAKTYPKNTPDLILVSTSGSEDDSYALEPVMALSMVDRVLKAKDAKIEEGTLNYRLKEIVDSGEKGQDDFVFIFLDTYPETPLTCHLTVGSWSSFRGNDFGGSDYDEI